MKGKALLFNIQEKAQIPIELQLQGTQKSNPTCNDVSFNSDNLLAIALDKVRAESSLRIFDTKRAEEGAREAISSLAANDLIFSTSFIPEEPQSIICGSYKSLREFDIRSSSPTFQIFCKDVHDITPDPFNSNFFAAKNQEKRTVSFFDRRFIQADANPLISVSVYSNQNKENMISCFRASSTRRGEFANLYDDSLIKRWQIEGAGFVNKDESTSRFISSIQTVTDLKNILSFDYVKDLEFPNRINIMCAKKNELIRICIKESPSAIRFDPFNNIVSTDTEHLTFITTASNNTSNSNGQNLQSISTNESALQENEDIDDDMASEEYEATVRPNSSNSRSTIVQNNFYYNVDHILDSDISSTIRKRAISNYSMNCQKNLEILNQYDDFNNSRLASLKDAWKWIERVQKSRNSLIQDGVDLSYQGILGIWEGWDSVSQKPQSSKFTGSEVENAITRIIERYRRKIYTNVTTSKVNQRQLCLRSLGWNFDKDQLEILLKQLKEKGEYEKAAGWAVFHNNIDRAVQILMDSENDQLRMMAAAIAGYDGYSNTTVDNTWKRLCKKMASDLENPYMRAIFAYIPDCNWRDVLDQASLPLPELLGIALRFLNDSQLTAYLKSITADVIKNGYIDGIILTGITSRAVDLIQSYVDKTADVQTAALIISFASPLYFKDERIDHWVECYRNLLNSWRLFSKRSMFDVARSRASLNSDGRISIKPVPRQVSLLCHGCKKPIHTGGMKPGIEDLSAAANGGSEGSFQKVDQKLSGSILEPSSISPVGNAMAMAMSQRKTTASTSPTAKQSRRGLTNQSENPAIFKGFDTNIKCPYCNYPLPRCAVCLMPLGSLSSRTKNDNSLKAMQNYTTINEAVSEVAPEAGAEDKHNQFDRFFVFCLSCNHGMHSNHARQWFSKHDICAVPDCECTCNQHQPFYN